MDCRIFVDLTEKDQEDPYVAFDSRTVYIKFWLTGKWELLIL